MAGLINITQPPSLWGLEMGLEIKRFFAYAITRAMLLSGAVLVGLLLSCELLAAVGIDAQVISPLSIVLVGCSIAAVVYCRFSLNVFGVRGLAAEGDSQHAKSCVVLVAIGAAMIFWLSTLRGSGTGLAIIAPGVIMMEEVIFRGLPLILLRRFRTSSAGRIGIAVVFSASFAALHVSPFVAMFADRFLFSLFALVLAIKSQSLWLSILYHLIANIVAMSVAAPFYNESQAWLYIPIDLAIFGLVFTVILSNEIKGTVSERTSVRI